jgi:hypothetical protein
MNLAKIDEARGCMAWVLIDKSQCGKVMPVFECNVIGVRYWGNRSPLEELGGNR